MEFENGCTVIFKPLKPEAYDDEELKYVNQIGIYDSALTDDVTFSDGYILSSVYIKDIELLRYNIDEIDKLLDKLKNKL